MDTKKPAKPVPATTVAKPAAVPTTTERRPPLPSFFSQPGHKSDSKMAAAGENPAAEATASEKVAQPASAPAEGTVAPTAGSKPAEVTSEKAATDSKTDFSEATEKPTEKLGPKIRKRDEILAALRAGAKVEKIDGLYRIVNPDGSKNATSKRRVLSLQSQKLLIASADGKTLTLDTEADAKAREKKAAAARTTAKPENPASAKPEETK